MTDQPSEQPRTIPYVDYHVGPKRTLVVNVTTQNKMLQGGKIPPVVSVDGRQYIVYWGTIPFEIPADRAVHVSVHVEGNAMTQAASALVPPGGDLTLTYATNYMSGIGSLR